MKGRLLFCLFQQVKNQEPSSSTAGVGRIQKAQGLVLQCYFYLSIGLVDVNFLTPAERLCTVAEPPKAGQKMQSELTNGWLRQLASEREQRGSPLAQTKEAQLEQEPAQKRRRRVQPMKAAGAETRESALADAKVIDLCASEESDGDSVIILDDDGGGEGAVDLQTGPTVRLQQAELNESRNRELELSLALAEASHGLAMRLQQEESTREQADSLALARLLQQRESAGEGPARAHSQVHGRSVHSSGSLPWPTEVEWLEQQHMTGPRSCGNFNLCDQGKTYFRCEALNETTGHCVTPVPLPGQTIKIRRMDGVRVVTAQGHERKQRPGIDGKTTIVTARTNVFKPFVMGSFAGSIETIRLSHGEEVYLLRNFDGVQGARLAAALEGCYGLDVLEGGGTAAKCAAAMGNNCQDDYRKLYPPRMFLDDALGELMRPLLDATLREVNQQRASGRQPPLSLRRGECARERVVGETQILCFRSSRKTVDDRGNRMHVHCDRPGTRWVALMALGDTSSFVLDNAITCEACFLPSCKAEHKGLKIRPNLNRGGTGVAKPGGHKYTEWHKIRCPSCRTVELRSGDCLLFYGCPTASVAHGCLSTHADTCPPHLPSWCKRGRVSTQYRMTQL